MDNPRLVPTHSVMCFALIVSHDSVPEICANIAGFDVEAQSFIRMKAGHFDASAPTKAKPL